MLLSIVLLIGIANHIQAFLAPGQPPLVLLQNGTIKGRHLPEFNQDLFLGVKYANAPRLSNPTSLDSPWCGAFDASEYGNTCYGFGSNTVLNFTQSEDCLNLNVIRPANLQSTDPLPVMLWRQSFSYYFLQFQGAVSPRATMIAVYVHSRH